MKKIWKSLYQNQNVNPEVTFVVPIFNQAENIVEVISKIISKSKLVHDILLIFDNCSDNSEHVVIEYLKNYDFTELTHSIEYLSSNRSLFETRCDAYGFRNAKTKFAIEIQADMLIQQSGFDASLLNVLNKFEDIIAISGRCCHKFSELTHDFQNKLGNDVMYGTSRTRWILNQLILNLHNRGANEASAASKLKTGSKLEIPLHADDEIFIETGAFGKLGILGESLISNINDFGNTIWLSETVNRGPLAIDLHKYHQLGGFNTKAFFLGMDEHDLFLRAWHERAWRTAYLPINYSSPLSIGSTRKPRPLSASIGMYLNSLIRKHRYKSARLVKLISALGSEESHKFNLPAPETRSI